MKILILFSIALASIIACNGVTVLETARVDHLKKIWMTNQYYEEMWFRRGYPSKKRDEASREPEQTITYELCCAGITANSFYLKHTSNSIYGGITVPLYPDSFGATPKVFWQFVRAQDSLILAPRNGQPGSSTNDSRRQICMFACERVSLIQRLGLNADLKVQAWHDGWRFNLKDQRTTEFLEGKIHSGDPNVLILEVKHQSRLVLKNKYTYNNTSLIPQTIQWAFTDESGKKHEIEFEILSLKPASDPQFVFEPDAIRTKTNQLAQLLVTSNSVLYTVLPTGEMQPFYSAQELYPEISDTGRQIILVASVLAIPLILVLRGQINSRVSKQNTKPNK